MNTLMDVLRRYALADEESVRFWSVTQDPGLIVIKAATASTFAAPSAALEAIAEMRKAILAAGYVEATLRGRPCTQVLDVRTEYDSNTGTNSWRGSIEFRVQPQTE